jgi:enediyne biosynthesis protein E4
MKVLTNAPSSRITFFLLLSICFFPLSDLQAEKMFTLLKPEQSGIKFRNDFKQDNVQNYFVNEYILNGAGVGVGDLNGDGLPDIVFAGNQVQSRIYLNQGGMKFKDVTKKSGIKNNRWHSGVCLVDLNSDGKLDIYFTATTSNISKTHSNQLYINKGGMKFNEEAAKWGIDDPGLSNHAMFFDMDNDSDLDLYVLNRSISESSEVKNDKMLANSAPNAQADKLFRNNGDGSFSPLGFDEFFVKYEAKGLGILSGDLDFDGNVDMYVSNDYEDKDLLFFGNGDGSFLEKTNFNMGHISYFSMGSDMADFDNDGHLDILTLDMTAEDNKRLKANMSGMNPEKFYQTIAKGDHLQYMFNSLQRNNGDGTFGDVGFLAGISSTDWSWAPLLADFDNDGDKDLVVTNGIRYDLRNSDFKKEHGVITNFVKSWNFLNDNDMFGKEVPGVRQDSLIANLKRYGFNDIKDFDLNKILWRVPSARLPNYAYENMGSMPMKKVSKEWGFDFSGYSQGMAWADLDRDGDLDLVVNNMDDFAHIYENNSDKINKNNYLRIKLEGNKGNVSGFNARVYAYVGTKMQLLEQMPTRGFVSCVEDILHFGIGKSNVVDSLVVIWQGGAKQTLKNIKANQLITLKQVDAKQKHDYLKRTKGLFAEVMPPTVELTHFEESYDDYFKEVLLPHKMSQWGPGMALGDINNDGEVDMVFGQASGRATLLLYQKGNNKFLTQPPKDVNNDKNQEDMGILLFDSDSDGDLDLYVVSGSNEYTVGTAHYQDRLYENLGNGKFKKTKNKLPEMFESGSCVVASDYDSDGDMDLFVGGRQTPGKYPHPCRSYILENNKGKFTDVTAKIAPDLLQPGMVTSALWTDFDADGDRDLIVTGEWMPIMFMENDKGKFKDVTKEKIGEKTEGWWWSVMPLDYDNDGDLDYVAGNLGLNYKYKASKEFPFSVHSDDFDQNGTNDIVLSYYNGGVCFPLRGRSCSSQQIAGIKKDFPSYNLFSEATLDEVYGVEKLSKSLSLDAYNFASSLIENKGDGTFELHSLPDLAQVSTIFGIQPFDFNADGNLDLLINGNLHQSEIETPRADASIGLYLMGDGLGGFHPTPLAESGFINNGDSRGSVMLPVESNRLDILVAVNNSNLQQYSFDDKIGRIEMARPSDEYAILYNKDSTSRKVEFNYGAGYLSQQARFVTLNEASPHVKFFTRGGVFDREVKLAGKNKRRDIKKKKVKHKRLGKSDS